MRVRIAEIRAPCGRDATTGAVERAVRSGRTRLAVPRLAASSSTDQRSGGCRRSAASTTAHRRHHMRCRTLSLSACAGVAFVLAVAGGAVAGDSPASWPGTVQTPAGVWGACFNKKTGALRLVNVAAGCRSADGARPGPVGPEGPDRGQGA